MKKLIALVVLLGSAAALFGQSAELGIGFQYGTARIFDKGTILREITEPGILLSGRLTGNTVGGFARIGLLFTSEVNEGDVTRKGSDFDYILFVNGAIGPSFNIPLSGPLSFVIDAGLDINDLVYGSSFKDDIDASWSIKIENLGATYTGGRKFFGVKMKETYNDVAIGIFANVAAHFALGQHAYLEAGGAASFDFIRVRSYSFKADFTNASHSGPGSESMEEAVSKTFPDAMVDGKVMTLEKNADWSLFKQFTFIPSITIGYRF